MTRTRLLLLGVLLAFALSVVAFWTWRAGPLAAYRMERDLSQAVQEWERAGAPRDALPFMTDGAPLPVLAYGANARSVSVTVGGGRCDESREVRVVESARGVALLALGTRSDRACLGDLVPVTLDVVLAVPVGDRLVFDGAHGVLLPRT